MSKIVKSGTAVTAISKATSAEAAVAIQQKLDKNIWATASRDSPNAEKLLDGAIQRQSVSVSYLDKQFVSQSNGVGSYKRPELNVRASAGSRKWTSPWDMQRYRYKVARIYMPQNKHVHFHPTNKSKGNYWALDFADWGSYKNPTMGWTSGTQDTFNGAYQIPLHM